MLNSFTQAHNTLEAVYCLFETNYSSTKTGNSNKILSMNVNMTSISIDKYIQRWTILFHRNWWKLSSNYLIHQWSMTSLIISHFLKHHALWFSWHHSYFFPHLLLCMFISVSSLGSSSKCTQYVLVFTGTLNLTYLLLLSLIMVSSATSTISKSGQNLSPELQILFPNWKLDTRICHKHPKLSTVTFRGLVFKLETPKWIGSFSSLC